MSPSRVKPRLNGQRLSELFASAQLSVFRVQTDTRLKPHERNNSIWSTNYIQCEHDIKIRIVMLVCIQIRYIILLRHLCVLSQSVYWRYYNMYCIYFICYVAVNLGTILSDINHTIMICFDIQFNREAMFIIK